jgi:TraR antiactivator
MTEKQIAKPKDLEDLSVALGELLEPLDKPQLESAAIDAIRSHRHLLEAAEQAYADWTVAKAVGDDTADELRQNYDRAMLSNKAQIAVVAALVDRLGYVPDVPSDEAPKLSDG